MLLSRRSEPMPFFVRYVDGDLLIFVHQGAGLLETEFGPLRYRAGDWVYVPKACTFRQVPDPRGRSEATRGRHGDHLADDRGHRRVPGAAAGRTGQALPVRSVAGRASPSPQPIADGDGPLVDGEYEVRLIH